VQHGKKVQHTYTHSNGRNEALCSAVAPTPKAMDPSLFRPQYLNVCTYWWWSREE